MAKQASRTTRKRQQGERTFVVPMACRVDVDLYNRFMNAVYALSGPPLQLGYTSTMRAAIEREVQRLERKHNQGQPFKARPDS